MWGAVSRPLASAVPDVVDSFEQDHVAGAGLLTRVALEPRDRARSAARSGVQHPVAADPFIDHAERRAGRRVQTRREEVRPARVGARRGTDTVGDRVAERDDRSERAAGAQDVHARQEVPRVRVRPERAAATGHVLSGGDVVDLLGVDVLGGPPGRPRQVDAHRQTRRGPDRERHRVAGRLRARRDQHRAPAAEVQRGSRCRSASPPRAPGTRSRPGRSAAARCRTRCSAAPGPGPRRRWSARSRGSSRRGSRAPTGCRGWQAAGSLPTSRPSDFRWGSGPA